MQVSSGYILIPYIKTHINKQIKKYIGKKIYIKKNQDCETNPNLLGPSQLVIRKLPGSRGRELGELEKWNGSHVMDRHMKEER